LRRGESIHKAKESSLTGDTGQEQILMMQDITSRYGKWSLVAGAAEGIGKAFSLALARRGSGVILVDEKKDLMERVADGLETRYHVPARSINLDLASDESAGVLMEVIKETACRMIIYNAAYSRVQKFTGYSPEELERYIRVNVNTPMQLLHKFTQFHSGTPDQRKGIIVMSSMAGSWGTGLLAPYGATKAFARNLAESLYFELKADGFDVLSCIAGATRTPGFLASGPEGGKRMFPVMSPGKVVEASLDSLGRKPGVVPGFRNRINYFMLSRILSRNRAAGIMNRAVGKIYRDKL
jgi:short-subunit dehydrogenase